jgi:RNA polymerase sigma-70 factor (ECF subfamily)
MEDWADERLLTATPNSPAAFDVFYRRHERAVLAYFVRRVRDGELAADLTMETFAAALLGTRRYRPSRGPGVAWLFGIARHRLLRAVERGKVEDDARRKLGLPAIELDDDMIERIERVGADERAERLLEQLPEEQAAAVRARVLDERSYEEIAISIEVSQAVVRKRVSRGLSRLRALQERRT